MKIALLFMLLIIAYLFGGSIPFENDIQNVLFQTPFFFILCAAFIIIMLFVCRKYGFKKRTAALQIMHLGVTILMIGVGLGALFGHSSTFYIPVDRTQLFDQVPSDDGSSYYDLGFDISVSDFSVETYPPDYALFSVSDESIELDRASQMNRQYVFKQLGTIQATDLMSDGIYSERVEYGDYILIRQETVDKHYEASLIFSHDGVEATEHTLQVNHPVSYAGWKFYLLSYDTESQEYISLQAKQDPGLPFVLTGIWITIIATFWQCLGSIPLHSSYHSSCKNGKASF